MVSQRSIQVIEFLTVFLSQIPSAYIVVLKTYDFLRFTNFFVKDCSLYFEQAPDFLTQKLEIIF